MGYKGTSDLCLLQQYTRENSGSLMERKKEERIEWPFVSGGEKKKERKGEPTKTCFPSPLLNESPSELIELFHATVWVLWHGVLRGFALTTPKEAATFEG